MPITAGTRLHFMGIGGIGMSGLADICLSRGAAVSGCDANNNQQVKSLRERGASIELGHHPEHVLEPLDLVVYSSAVPADNPELLRARERGLRVISRGELLAELAQTQRLIGVAGAHGKTTTSGMASQLLLEAGWDPTIVVGGVMRSLGTNAKYGTGTYLVAETDESDGSFLHLSPDIAIVTNIDREHLNYYHTFEQLVAAFQRFVGQIRPDGVLITCGDDPVVSRTLRHDTQVRYGFSPGCDLTVDDLRLDGQGSVFRASFRGRRLGTFRLNVPGRHNVLNALSILCLGLVLDIPLLTVRAALAKFAGARRRFELTRLPGDIWFVEDYAHHPSEIRATLSAGAQGLRHRLVVFQPHRFSRTQSLEQEFSECFESADGVIVTDIYPAFEAPIPGVSGERLARLIKSKGHPCVRYVPKAELSHFVQRIARSGDTIFFLGAGDIGELCHVVAKQIDPAERSAR